MVAAGATEAVGQGKDAEAGRSPRGMRKVRAGLTGGVEVQRFFLAKIGGNNGVPEFSKEVPGEPEAMVESLKTGLSYFVVSEWRGVADFSGKKPQLGREPARSGPNPG
jgi:hypothetical protein